MDIKIDGSARVLKSETHLHGCVKKAKKIMGLSHPDHTYYWLHVIPNLLILLVLLFEGETEEDRIVTVQTIAGIGARYLTFGFLAKKVGVPSFYIWVSA